MALAHQHCSRGVLPPVGSSKECFLDICEPVSNARNQGVIRHETNQAVYFLLPKKTAKLNERVRRAVLKQPAENRDTNQNVVYRLFHLFSCCLESSRRREAARLAQVAFFSLNSQRAVCTFQSRKIVYTPILGILAVWDGIQSL
jgi:hypothetical protein